MRANKLTWFLGFMVVMLTFALTLQTAYLVWLHRQLYLAVAGADSGLADLERLLNAEVGVAHPAANKTVPEKREKSATADDLSNVKDKAEQMLSQALKDPALKGLLGDLGIETPATGDQTKVFRPDFKFEDRGESYLVTVELPGMLKSDVRAAVDNGVLKVSGKHEGVAFRESFAFPGPIVPGSEDIGFRDGKLTVTAQKLTPKGGYSA
jgi:HSP20 family molecular chaperone IbpA